MKNTTMKNQPEKNKIRIIKNNNYTGITSKDFMILWEKKGIGKHRLMIATKNHTFFLFKKTKFFQIIKYNITNLIFIITEDIDCDGTSYRKTDRLTDGKIYYFYGWHYDYYSNYGRIKRIFGINLK